ncbi:hypothetical protein SteCoe_36561 [Stentor coeruleus]|uniref:FHA domain-containing protein n=1 Tax=Stentor coeruleus TaxID=5963 RepID=A0A1R2APT2_9CILI|nr:hypothetical protein SteCoe_36561 [Stentor coeruleus]
MESQIKIIKKDMRHYGQTYFITDTGEVRKERFLSLQGMLFVLKKSEIKAEDKLIVIGAYEEIIKTLKGENQRAMLDNYLEEAENLFLYSIALTQNLIRTQYEETLNWARSHTYCLGNLLTYFLYYKLYNEINENIDFLLFWDEHFSKLIKNFNIENTLFIKQLARKYVCGQANFSEQSTVINKENIIDLFDAFFSEPLNFKFIYRASFIFKQFSGFFNKPNYNCSLQITCTAINRRCKMTEETVNEGRIYSFWNSILEGNKLRHDNFITFGKTTLADIVLPKEDNTLDLLNFAIYFDGEKWLMIDCSRKTNTKINMIPSQPYLIKPGTLISIAGLTNLWIKNIQIELDSEVYHEDESPVHSTLFFEYIDGHYSDPFGDKMQIASTKEKGGNKIKNEFVFGKGGDGKKVDFFCHLDGYAGGEHMKLNYHSNNNEWTATDLKSKNRTYIQLKNYDQFMERRISKIIPLFIGKYDIPGTDEKSNTIQENSELPQNGITISIGNYAFYIVKLDN